MTKWGLHTISYVKVTWQLYTSLTSHTYFKLLLAEVSLARSLFNRNTISYWQYTKQHVNKRHKSVQKCVNCLLCINRVCGGFPVEEGRVKNCHTVLPLFQFLSMLLQHVLQLDSHVTDGWRLTYCIAGNIGSHYLDHFSPKRKFFDKI